MKRSTSYISRHANFDDHHYWTFARSSGLPRGYFDKRPIITWDSVLVVAGLVILAVVVGVIVGSH